MSLLEQICLQHSETARTIYEKRGHLTPKLWAQGLDRMIVAEPIDTKATDATTDEFRATLCIAMALRVDAIAIGRSDEAFIRSATPDTVVVGALRRLADTDPEIRTCLISEAVSLGGSEEITIVATHGLDDWGRHDWVVTRSVNGTMRSLVPLQVARDMITDGLPDFWRDPTALDQFAGQIRWNLQTFPQPTSW